MTIAEPITNPLFTRNMLASTSNTTVCRSGLANEIMTITRMINTNVIDMRSRNGKSGKAPLVSAGRNLSRVEMGMVNNGYYEN